jgi:hypothetical protein
MREKKHQYYVTQRTSLLKKMKKRTDQAEKVIKRNLSEKENIKASRAKEFSDAEVKIKQKISEHFDNEEKQRQALEVEIDSRSNF